ncbi:MAG TPA: hypothetical protein PKA37_06775 [Planctomycetota bacterium]|jgi:hypothetical protein|nr:hypothetical protein [Planctomycetota bacterium]
MRPTLSPLKALFLLFSFTLASCACPDAPTLQRYGEYTLGTPTGALEYFRLAVQRKDAYHQYLCFSKEMRDLNPDLTVANLSSYQDKLTEMVREEIGSVDDLEIESEVIRKDQPFLATVIVADGARKQAVTLVLETSYSIIWTDGTATHGHLPAGANPLSIRSGRLMLDVSIRERMQAHPGSQPALVHSVSLSRDWKILRTEKGPLADALRKKIDGASPPPKS